MGTTELFLIVMIAIYALPWLVWRIGHTDHWAPLVVVQIVGGILLGPGILGAAFPDAWHAVFTQPVTGALSGIAWWAVMLFVWVAGLELDLAAAWTRRRDTAITAGLALGTPLLLGAAAGLALLHLQPGWAGPAGKSWQVVLGIGMSCAVTALPILILFLERLEILRTPLGQRVLRYASLDDIAIWGVLALILLDWTRIGRQAAFLLLYVAASAGMRRLLPRLREADRWPVGLIWLAAVAFAADWSGLHFMVGAFLSGAVLDARWFGEKRVDAFRGMVLLALMPVFFLSTGLRTQWSMGGWSALGAAALLLAASVVGKLLGIGIAGRLLGWAKSEALLIGWLLQTKALIMIIFVNVLLDRQLISSDLFTALLLMAVGSTMLTIPAVAPRLSRIDPQRAA